MKTHLSATLLAGLLIASPISQGATKIQALDAIAAAEQARQRAAAIGGEWRDTGKLIKKAKQSLEAHLYTQAVELANQARLQGKLGYEQAMRQRNAGFPQYMIAFVESQQAAEIARATASETTSDQGIQPFQVLHDGKPVTIARAHDKKVRLPQEFLQAGRHCPPFCIQPIRAAEGVETIGELEMLDFLKKMADGKPVLVIDSRTPEWVLRGTIPGSINIPWTQIDPQQQGMFGDPGEDRLRSLMIDRFGVMQTEEGDLDFSQAKTLVLFCNGLWCGQSHANIRTLLRAGYPPEKLKWYRGGMQDWAVAGLTIVKPSF